ncbi:MAG: DNA mismatch repair endonuclease MutL [Spirochaetia bacterium]
MDNTPTSRRVHILRDSVARKIAAGEVIERPYSVVRELLDNAIDAGATAIDVSVEQGGLKRISVSDNGEGMNREDLELCFHPHATSKIESAEDIYCLSTLGFRGEALSSISACSKLTITSAAETGEAHSLEIREGKKEKLAPAQGKKGTRVEVRDLFYSMPGRRKFLKSTGAETSACKKTLIEKALPYPDLTFRFFKDGSLDLHLPPASPVKRTADAYPGIFTTDFLYRTDETAGDFSFTAVLSSPSISRKDRRYIQIYVNGRRIQEFSLIQAVEYAYRSILPGGSFPAAFLFLTVNPELVDFNIHPAKREAKIKNLSAIHHEVTERIAVSLKRFAINTGHNAEGEVAEYGLYGEDDRGSSTSASTSTSAHSSTSASTPVSGGAAPFPNTYSGRVSYPPPTTEPRELDISRLKQIGKNTPDNHAEEEPLSGVSRSGAQSSDNFVYHGQAFGFFLIIERSDELLLIDQHAAHERIIYNDLLSSSGKKQSLLLSRQFRMEAEEEELLLSRIEEFRNLNIYVEQEKEGIWNLTAVPEKCTGMEREIIEFLQSPKERVSSIETALYADIACKRAVKEGEHLDPTSSSELIKKTLSLPEARCPHGRPVWISLSKSELTHLIGRT